jgi:histidinol-phosphate aminotransferase
MLKTVADIRYQRDRLSLELTELGFEVYRSEANFVLFRGVKSSAESFESLLSQGILVRDVGIANTLRVSAGTETETSRFLEAASNLAKL